MARTSHFAWFHHRNSRPIWPGMPMVKLSIMQCLTVTSYIVPLRSKYLPQHLILKHPQNMFLPQWQRPSFTPL
jgi:hypothetical protein